MADSNHARRNILIGLALALITLAIYWPATGFEFTNYDDGLYVSENPHLTAGSLADKLSWAFTSGYAVNWHPLTWLSHMLDVWVYGMNPAGHHLTNLIFHAANAVLLFCWLLQMTSRTWCSAFVAALFAWHPMHVESVAWVAERKDVLSTFFGLLTLIAYGKYAKELKGQGSSYKIYYVLALACFALGLMSKPMLVTMPLILLLLDFWPLGRIYDIRFTIYELKGGLARLVLEKVPFFVLTVISSVVTYFVQKTGGAMAMLTHLSFGERLANAIVAYVRYIDKLVWPHDLAVLYPYNHSLPMWQVLMAGLLLALLSVYALAVARKRPYVTVGWFWFVITLVPVIGLVQVGEQSIADRYTYIPATGLFILVTWGAAEALGSRLWSRYALSLSAVLVMAACLIVTRSQLRYWRNTEVLFIRALEISADNPTAHNNLGWALDIDGKYAEAITHFNLARDLRPKWDMPYNNLGIALLGEGKIPEAITNLQKAIEISPDYAAAMVNLGIALGRQGKMDEAVAEYRKALKVGPSSEAHNRLGGALESQGKIEEAAAEYEAALKIRPNFAEAHVNLAAILNAQGKFELARQHLLAALKSKPDLAAAHYNLGNCLGGLGETGPAVEEYATALRLKPDDAQTHLNLANLLARQQQWDEAIRHYSETLRLRPEMMQAHVNLAIILNRQGRTGQAIEHYRSALRIDPNAFQALENLAWILATHPDPKMRDGAEAVRLATLAAQSPAATEAAVWYTQAAAFAAAGKNAEAISAAKKAIELAKAQQNKGLAEQIQTRLQRYEAGEAFY